MFPSVSRKYNECPANLIKKYSPPLSRAHKDNPTKISKSKNRNVLLDKQNIHTISLVEKNLNSMSQSLLKQKRTHKQGACALQLQKIRMIEQERKKIMKQNNKFEEDQFDDIFYLNDIKNGNTFSRGDLDEKTKDCKDMRQVKKSSQLSFTINNSLLQVPSCVSIKKITTAFKPPHRYKTTIAITKNCLILYGGLGCEKDLSWAKLNFDEMKWDIYKISSQKNYLYKPQTPIYGHSMVMHKNKAIIYGGIHTAQINQTTILKIGSTISMQQGERGPNRRKYHAAIVTGDHMIIHGGIQSKQTKSDFLVYNIAQNKWIIVAASNAPALSSHKITTTFQKKKSKLLYIFGGISDKGKCRNKLFSVQFTSQKEIKCEQVQTINPPKPRHSFCFEGISNNQLLLYGGKQIEEETDNYTVKQGVFNDIHLFNVDTKTWTQVYTKTKMSYCFGMASSSLGNRVFIFGGSSHQNYCDASIYVFSLSSATQNYHNTLEIDRNCFQSENRIRFSNKTLISKNALE